MYSCNESIQYYQILINSELNKNTNIYLIPISGFYENDSCYWTKKYIELKNRMNYEAKATLEKTQTGQTVVAEKQKIQEMRKTIRENTKEQKEEIRTMYK